MNEREKVTKMMKAAVMTKLRHMEFQERPIPKITHENQVLIKMKHVGICGSDLHYYEHGRIGEFVVRGPIVLGHECSGQVIEIGAGVTHVSPGDLVAIEPGYGCGNCIHCINGHYNLCEQIVFMATPPYDGALMEYVCYPSHVVFKLPPSLTTVEGALMEPLAVGLHASNQANATIGQSALILGSGPIGLVTLLSLKARGLTEIYVADLIQKRLDMAIEMGASATFGPHDLHDQIMRATDNKGVDLVFETAGSVPTTQQSISMVKRGGTIVLIGMVPEPLVPFDFCELIVKEVNIKTVFRYRHVYPTAIRAVEAGVIDPTQLVTHRFKFHETPEAFNFYMNNKSDIVKTMIEF